MRLIMRDRRRDGTARARHRDRHRGERCRRAAHREKRKHRQRDPVPHNPFHLRRSHLAARKGCCIAVLSRYGSTAETVHGSCVPWRSVARLPRRLCECRTAVVPRAPPEGAAADSASHSQGTRPGQAPAGRPPRRRTARSTDVHAGSVVAGSFTPSAAGLWRGEPSGERNGMPARRACGRGLGGDASRRISRDCLRSLGASGGSTPEWLIASALAAVCPCRALVSHDRAVFSPLSVARLLEDSMSLTRLWCWRGHVRGPRERGCPASGRCGPGASRRSLG